MPPSTSLSIQLLRILAHAETNEIYHREVAHSALRFDRFARAATAFTCCATLMFWATPAAPYLAACAAAVTMASVLVGWAERGVALRSLEMRWGALAQECHELDDQWATEAAPPDGVYQVQKLRRVMGELHAAARSQPDSERMWEIGKGVLMRYEDRLP